MILINFEVQKQKITYVLKTRLEASVTYFISTPTLTTEETIATGRKLCTMKIKD